VYTAAQSWETNGQEVPTVPPEEAVIVIKILGIEGECLAIVVNGERQSWKPKGSTTLTELLTEFATAVELDHEAALDLLKRKATLQSSVTEATMMANMGSGISPPMDVVHHLKYFRSKPDKGDGHVHRCVLDLNGNGLSEVAGRYPHTHIVDRYQVRKFVADVGGSFESAHDEGIEEDLER